MGDRPAQSVYNYLQLPGYWSPGPRRGWGGGLVVGDCFPQLVFNCLLSSCNTAIKTCEVHQTMGTVVGTEERIYDYWRSGTNMTRG